MVKVGYAWPASVRRLFLETRDVSPEKLNYEPGPLPGFDVERCRREPITRDLKRAFFRLDGNECVYCSATTLLEVDHIYPHSLGGTCDVENLVTCCNACNKKKRGRITPPPLVFGRFRSEAQVSGAEA
jgi:hypothetical protein